MSHDSEPKLNSDVPSDSCVTLHAGSENVACVSAGGGHVSVHLARTPSTETLSSQAASGSAALEKAQNKTWSEEEPR